MNVPQDFLTLVADGTAYTSRVRSGPIGTICGSPHPQRVSTNHFQKSPSFRFLIDRSYDKEKNKDYETQIPISSVQGSNSIRPSEWRIDIVRFAERHFVVSTNHCLCGATASPKACEPIKMTSLIPRICAEVSAEALAPHHLEKLIVLVLLSAEWLTYPW